LIQIGHETRYSEPKTKSSRRTIALDPATVALLKASSSQAATRKTGRGPDWQDTGLLFTQEDGPPLHPDRFDNLFRRLSRRSGVPEIPFHRIRHTYATLALLGKVQPKIVSERLGHANISITLDTHSHVIPGMQEEAAEVVARMLFSNS
jgi:integrase